MKNPFKYNKARQTLESIDPCKPIPEFVVSDGAYWTPLKAEISTFQFIEGNARGQLKMINGKVHINVKDYIGYGDSKP
jgi:hypothetical protein